MSAIAGVVIGLVKDVDDPLGEGRVRISLPLAVGRAAAGGRRSRHRWPAKNRGYFYLPEIDDEALVAFEQGDVDHPFVIGFLHNGVDMPPDDGIDKHVRRIKFGQRPRRRPRRPARARRRCRSRPTGGHSLEMRDADGTIEIVTSGRPEGHAAGHAGADRAHDDRPARR